MLTISQRHISDTLRAQSALRQSQTYPPLQSSPVSLAAMHDHSAQEKPEQTQILLLIVIL